MQRYKMHVAARYGQPERGTPWKGYLHTNRHGKFVYGAPGTLCTAAQWRDSGHALLGAETILPHGVRSHYILICAAAGNFAAARREGRLWPA